VSNRLKCFISGKKPSQFREILTRPEAKRVLFDPDRGFQDALSIAQQEELSHLWATDVAAAIRSLEAMGTQELKRLTEEDIELLKKLASVVQERLVDRQSTDNFRLRVCFFLMILHQPSRSSYRFGW
jgi:hypothetical protein